MSETDTAHYLPTPEEIAEGCRLIQAEWSEAERRKRGAWMLSSWTVPGVTSEANEPVE